MSIIELPYTKPINRFKSNKGIKYVKTVKHDETWKTNRSKAIKVQSRAENYVDQDDFQLPETIRSHETLCKHCKEKRCLCQSSRKPQLYFDELDPDVLNAHIIAMSIILPLGAGW